VNIVVPPVSAAIVEVMEQMYAPIVTAPERGKRLMLPANTVLEWAANHVNAALQAANVSTVKDQGKYKRKQYL